MTRLSWLPVLGMLCLVALPALAGASEVELCAGEPLHAAGLPIESGLLMPEAVELAVCSASQTCPGGQYISCSCPGVGQCTSGATSVTCDCTPNPDYHYTCPTTECTPGQEKQEPDGCCSPNKGRFRWYVCNASGYWEPTIYTTCYGGCNPILPD